MNIASPLLQQTAEYVGITRARRLSDEASTAVAGMRTDGWAKLLAFSASAAVVGTVASKVRGLQALGEMTVKATIAAHRQVRDKGAIEAVAQLPSAAQEIAAQQQTMAAALWMKWQGLGPADKRLLVRDALVAGVTAYFVAGGADLEGGLPDLDLLFGVGAHRNPFSHTFLIALATEMAVRFSAASLATLHARLPAEHDPAWDAALNTFERSYEAAIVGVWFGTAGHLLKDAGLPWAATKPISGLPIPLTMAGHKVLLAGNAAAAAGTGALQVLGLNLQYTRVRDLGNE